MQCSIEKKQGNGVQFHSFGWGALVVSLTLAACASVGANSPEDRVRQRAGERWKYLIAGDFSRAYAYSSQAFQGIVPQDTFRARFGSAVTWVGSEVVAVSCPEATKCMANIRIDYKPIMGGRQAGAYNTHVEETWLLEDGQWSVFQPIKSQ